MRNMSFTGSFRVLAPLTILLGWFPACPVVLQAQDNAVYDSTGGNTTHSTAFIDARRVAQTFERKMN
jgi:hypothetical protein